MKCIVVLEQLSECKWLRVPTHRSREPVHGKPVVAAATGCAINLDFRFRLQLWCICWYKINSLLLNVKDLTFMCTCVVQQQPVQRNPVVGSKVMLHNLRALCGLQILQQIFSDINVDEIRLKTTLLSVSFLFCASRNLTAKHRRDICHKHHKQRLCKIIITRVKLHFVKVLLEQLLHVYFQFWVIFSHLNQC